MSRGLRIGREFLHRKTSLSNIGGSSTRTTTKRKKEKKNSFNSDKYYHGIEVVLLKSRTVENLKRWFFHCSLYK
ncbi:hypothetical protein AHAS_Ahas02G0115800 [Arachis hypogaea]